MIKKNKFIAVNFVPLKIKLKYQEDIYIFNDKWRLNCEQWNTLFLREKESAKQLPLCHSLEQ